MHSLIIRSIALLFLCLICCPVYAMDIDAEEEISDHSPMHDLHLQKMEKKTHLRIL